MYHVIFHPISKYRRHAFFAFWQRYHPRLVVQPSVFDFSEPWWILLEPEVSSSFSEFCHPCSNHSTWVFFFVTALGRCTSHGSSTFRGSELGLRTWWLPSLAATQPSVSLDIKIRNQFKSINYFNSFQAVSQASQRQQTSSARTGASKAGVKSCQSTASTNGITWWTSGSWLASSLRSISSATSSCFPRLDVREFRGFVNRFVFCLFSEIATQISFNKDLHLSLVLSSLTRGTCKLFFKMPLYTLQKFQLLNFQAVIITYDLTKPMFSWFLLASRTVTYHGNKAESEP